MKKLLILFLVHNILTAQLAFSDKEKMLSFDANLTHILPAPNSESLTGVQLRLAGLWWIPYSGSYEQLSTYLSSEHLFNFAFSNNSAQGLTTDFLPFIYLGDVGLTSQLAMSWPLGAQRKVLFSVNWLGLETLLLPFKDTSWHEISLRLMNKASLSIFWDENNFFRLSATPFFFVPGISIKNFSRPDNSGYTVSMSAKGHFYGEIAFYTRLKHSFHFSESENHPFLGVFLALQLLSPDIAWQQQSPNGIDWSNGTNVAQLQLGLRSWLGAPAKK